MQSRGTLRRVRQREELLLYRALRRRVVPSALGTRVHPIVRASDECPRAVHAIELAAQLTMRGKRVV